MHDYKLVFCKKEDDSVRVQTSVNGLGNPVYRTGYKCSPYIVTDSSLAKPILEDRVVASISNSEYTYLQNKVATLAKDWNNTRKETKTLYELYPNIVNLRLKIADLDYALKHSTPLLLKILNEYAQCSSIDIHTKSYPAVSNIDAFLLYIKITYQDAYMRVRAYRKHKSKGILFKEILDDFCSDNKIYRYLEGTRPRFFYELALQYLESNEAFFHFKDLFSEDSLKELIHTLDTIIPEWVYDFILRFKSEDTKRTFETNSLYKLAYLISKEEMIVGVIMPTVISSYLNTKIVSPELFLFEENYRNLDNLYFTIRLTKDEEMLKGNPGIILEADNSQLIYHIVKEEKVTPTSPTGGIVKVKTW